jgi:ketosteroid isomerase-like protein
MSQENVEIVRRGLEYRRVTGDFPDELVAPDHVWDASTFRGWPEQPAYHGIEGAHQFIAEWTAAFDDWEIELVEAYDAGADKVVGVLRQRGRSKSTGLPVDMQLAMVFTLRNGQLIRREMYADPAEALNAVGLEE